jgi:hypothetical protein
MVNYMKTDSNFNEKTEGVEAPLSFFILLSWIYGYSLEFKI